MNAAKSLAILLLAHLCLGQGLTINLHLIEPDPGTGIPLLVLTPCASEEDWETPIAVYSDANVEVFIDKRCLITSAESIGQDGNFSVQLYSHYKGDYYCRQVFADYKANPTGKQKLAAAGLDEKELKRECELIHYKVRRMSVDTHGRRAKFTRIDLLDKDGTTVGSLKGDADWHPISGFDRDSAAVAVRTTIDRVTALVEEEHKGLESKPRK